MRVAPTHHLGIGQYILQRAHELLRHLVQLALLDQLAHTGGRRRHIHRRWRELQLRQTGREWSCVSCSMASPDAPRDTRPPRLEAMA